MIDVKWIVFAALIWGLIAQTYVTQLVDPRFPDKVKSSRKLTNNKRLFKAYAHTEMLVTLYIRGVVSAQLQINGHDVSIRETLKIAKSLKEDYIKVNITKYLHDGGDNTFSLQNILPNGAIILAYVPYPTLSRGTPESVGISSTLLKKVDDLINSDISNGFPGACLLIIKNGKIVKETAYGYARKFTDEGKLMDKFEDMKIDTMFDMASNTKMFATIFSLMKLHSDGILDYTNPITKYIPEYTGKDSEGHDRSKIEVFDALTHIAGYVPLYRFYNDKNSLYSRTKKLTEYYINQKLDLERNRGGHPKYSDVDYMIGGFLVEHITKMQLQDYTDKMFYSRLGLKRTGFNPLKRNFSKKDAAATEIFGNTRNHTVHFKDVRTTVIQGEVHDENSFYSVEGTSGHAGLFSTVQDMAVLLQVLLNKGGFGNVRLWSRDTQDLFLKPYDLALDYGIGWRRQGNEYLRWHFGTYASNQAVGHTGWTGTCTVIDPKYDLGIVLLTNKKHSRIIHGEFEGDSFETGKFGSVMQLIYESFLHNN